MKTNSNEIELYIHIPFCVKKCNYCDFLSFVSEPFTREMYVNALCSEIRYKGSEVTDRIVTSIYIGGGTPSSLETKLIVRIMDAINDTFTISSDAEITMECNPGTLDFDCLSVYKSLGINRLSIGLQSTNDEELKLLGRIHDYSSFLKSLDGVMKAGFDNYNVDIMYGLPGQDIKSLRKTLSDVTRFNPKHLSVYSLIIEEGTLFYDKYYDDYINQCKGLRTSFLPEENVLCEMTDFVKAFLKGRGLEQYEISNYAKRGYECRHNIGYWTRKNYLGFGLGAASLYEETRYKNITDIDKYINNWTIANPINEYEETEQLTVEDSMSEFMLLGLRMVDGISIGNFYDTYGRDLFEVYGNELDKLVAQELIINDGNFIKPTRKGLELQNIIAGVFV